MSIETYITSIRASRNEIRTKLVEMGLSTNTDKLDALATAIKGIIDRGAVSVTLQEGNTYTIPKGYHNGSGTVTGVGGGGNYNLQSKSATPSKAQQSITPDDGYFGLSDVTVAPIPDKYQDVSDVTATADTVLTGKIIVLADGSVVTGTMANNGAVAKTLDSTTISYTVPKGYHGGTGTVKIVLETKTVTPTKTAQSVKPSSGKVLSEVVVNAIPDNYVDKTGATAINATIDGLTQTSVTIDEGYTLGGTVSLTNDIETALAAI